MTPKHFIDSLMKEVSRDYGLCPPPIKAEKGLDILIRHFLGDDWYVVMPLSQEQVYTEAICAILEKTQKKKKRNLLYLKPKRDE